MLKKKIDLYIMLICIIIISLISYIIGYNIQKNRCDTNTKNIINTTTFYATITNIEKDYMHVNGLDINDINYQGEFTFSISKNTNLEWRGTRIENKDLTIGDNISITFTGEVQETYPAKIHNVIRIQLLKDKEFNKTSTSKPKVSNNKSDKSDDITSTTITTKDNRDPNKIKIEVIEDTITRKSAKILITDNNASQSTWGLRFKLQKKTNDEWKTLDYISDNVRFNAIGYRTNGENNQLTMTVDYGKYYGTLEDGIYRIVKTYDVLQEIDLYSNEFTIK